MPRGALRIGVEVVTVLVVLASLAGALGLIVALHRRHERPRRAPVVVVPPPSPPRPRIVESPPKPAPPPEPVEDPTPRELARLAAIEAEERKAAEDAERRSASLAAEIEANSEQLEAIRGRHRKIHEALTELEGQARSIEGSLDRLARQRDVLAQTRDEARVELALARSKDGLAVMPYKGPNGTWRRPIPIECRDGTATIQPGGPTFRLVELSALGSFRSHPLVAAVSRYLAHAERGRSPDGAPVIPYILFVVRPDGIRPYYEARGILEPLGISFGYELVEQETELEFPDLDDPIEWSETPPLRFAREGWPAANPTPGGEAGADADPFRWPTTPPGPLGGLSALGSGPDLGGPVDTPEGPGSLPLPPAEGAPELGAGEDAGLLPPGLGDGGIGNIAGGRPDSGIPGRITGGPAIGSFRPDGAGGITSPDGAGGITSPPVAAAPRSGSARDGLNAQPSGSTPSAAIGAAGMPGGSAGGGVDGSTFRMERPLNLVVACGPSGVTIQPGGYRLTRPALEPSDAKLVTMLRGIVKRREAREPSHVVVKPRLTFLVEPGGQETYWKARQQTVLAGLGWPVRLRVAEGSVSTENLLR